MVVNGKILVKIEGLRLYIEYVIFIRGYVSNSGVGSKFDFIKVRIFFSSKLKFLSYEFYFFSCKLRVICF